ncbi:MAG TPA: hypothetical protein VIY26_08605 [Acidimicrobiales bacterium]
MRERWLSGRAVTLHVAALVLVPGCAIAAWWQVNRAADGNQLSYVYSVMWPVFGLLALIFWWMLIHTDYDSVGLKGMLRQQADADAEAQADAQTFDLAASSRTPDGVAASPLPSLNVTEEPLVSADEDPELAAYNARLAALAAKGAKTWRNRETVVVRRAQ